MADARRPWNLKPVCYVCEDVPRMRSDKDLKTHLKHSHPDHAYIEICPYCFGRFTMENGALFHRCIVFDAPGRTIDEIMRMILEAIMEDGPTHIDFNRRRRYFRNEEIMKCYLPKLKEVERMREDDFVFPETKQDVLKEIHDTMRDLKERPLSDSDEE